MSRGELPQLVQDLLYADEHRLLNDELGLAVRHAISNGLTDDPFLRHIIEYRVHRHAVTQAFAGPFPIPRLAEGDVVAGTDLHGSLLRYSLQFLNAHTLTVGGSGSGKTTRARFTILQVAPRVRGCWLFDFRKREYAPLRPFFAKLGLSLVVVPAHKMRINPLQVPAGVHPSDWASRVADMLVQVFDLPPRATKLLHVTLLQLYGEYAAQGAGDQFPTLFDLRQAIAASADANPQARLAIVDSLDPVLLSLGPSVLAYRRGWNSGDLASRHLVFELDGVAEVDKDLILNSLLLPEFTSRVAKGVSNVPMNLFISCDEALRLVAASSSRSSMADLLGLIRGTGIGLDLSVQSSEVLPSILSNTATKFIGRCGSATDYERFAAAMGLTNEQRRWLSLNLQPGLFVGQLGEGGWRHPFVVRIPPMQLPSNGHLIGTGDDRGLQDLLSLPTVPAPEFRNWRPGGQSLEVASATEVEPAKPGLSDAAARFLQAVVDQPGQASSAYVKLAGVSTRHAAPIRHQLVELGFIREHSVATNKRGRPSIILEPTASGEEALSTSSKHCAGAKS